MFSIRLSYFLPVFILFSAALTGAQEVITASRGETVVLPCSSPFQYSDRVHFMWRKDGEPVPCQYYVKNNKTDFNNCQSRFKVNPELFGLTITDVRRSDAGVYNCSITKSIPPPTDEKYSVLILKVPAGLTVEQMKSSDLSCVDLLCSLEGLSPEQVNCTWTRGSEILLLHQNVQNMNSSLHLCKPQWTNGDTITCHASYSSTHTLYSQNITLTYPEKDSPHSFPAINVILFCIFVIVITVMWMVYFIHSRKRAWAFTSESPPAEPQNETVSRC